MPVPNLFSRFAPLVVVGAVLATAGEIPVRPGPSQGKIEAGGKFVPAFVDPKQSSAPPLPKDIEAFAKSLVQMSPDGSVSIGRVRMDPKARRISIPAQVNTNAGLVEYVLVTRQGKVHEALLATDASPTHLHLAFLLLDLAPQGGTNRTTHVRAEVEWKGNGPTRRMPVSEWLMLTQDSPEGGRGSVLQVPSWDVGRAEIRDGRLSAEIEGSILSLIGDPSALINLPHRGPINDRLYACRTGKIPVVGMPVTLHLTPVPAAAADNASFPGGR